MHILATLKYKVNITVSGLSGTFWANLRLSHNLSVRRYKDALVQHYLALHHLALNPKLAFPSLQRVMTDKVGF